MLVRLALAALLSAAVAAGDAAAAPWSPSHVVVVIEENHAFAQIIGNPDAPFINKLAAEGALFTDAHGDPPSEPAELPRALLRLDPGHHRRRGGAGHAAATPNLGAALIAKGYTFAGYSEDLPDVGSLKHSAHGGYARKHNPWSNWQADEPGPNQLPAERQPALQEFPLRLRPAADRRLRRSRT